MSVKELLPNQPVTVGGDLPSQELVEIIQRLTRKIRQLEAQIEALTP